jgi:two-component system sensor histidine kinase PilS (NtrC family)
VHLLIADWSVHVGALFLVGVLASVLTGELRRAGDALDRRTSDLRRLRDLHERTVESLMSGLLTCDLRGFITTFNPEAERIVGRAAEDVIGREVDAVVLGAASLLASVEEDPADPTARTRLQFRRHDGEVLSLGLSASILMDEDGGAMGHVLIFQDVTPVVAMEMDLWRSERMAAVGEMAAKIAHEIRNPLAAISGAIQVMQGGVGEPEEQPQLMEIVVRETDRLNVLITDFLRYARPGPLKRERVPLANLIDELLKLLESVRPDGVEIRAECGEPVAVYADPGQLRQVLWNLCINALQAMPDGGLLRVQSGSVIGKKPQGGPEGRRNGAEGVTSAETCEWGEIVVADNGVGIPEETLEQIFEPFFTTKPEGSGLGLSSVHRIVESHGGVLQLSSQKGEGTVVRVRLPLAREAEVGESAKDAEGST